MVLYVQFTFCLEHLLSANYCLLDRVLEIQTIISKLLCNFKFSLLKDHMWVLHEFGFMAMFPLVKGREKEGVQIPLQMAACRVLTLIIIPNNIVYEPMWVL